MKYITFMITAVALLSVSGVVNAEEEAEAAFPQGVAVTELSEKEQKEAQKILDQAVATYDQILDDKNEGKQEYLSSNMEFVTERIAKMETELSQKRAALEALKMEVLKKDKMIDGMSVSAEHKGKKKIQLVSEYANRQEALEFRIGMVERHVANLKKRQNAVKAEMQDLAIEPAGTQMTAAEEAELRIQMHKAEQKMDRFAKYTQ